MTRTVTLSRVMTSCGGTFSVTVRRSTRTIWSTIGIRNRRPGPLRAISRPSRKTTPRSYSRRIRTEAARTSRPMTTSAATTTNATITRTLYPVSGRHRASPGPQLPAGEHGRQPERRPDPDHERRRDRARLAPGVEEQQADQAEHERDRADGAGDDRPRRERLQSQPEDPDQQQQERPRWDRRGPRAARTGSSSPGRRSRCRRCSSRSDFGPLTS